jgi:hypothetical protein
MAGEEYESPVTGLKYTVPIYEEPADAPLAFKEFADSITVGGPASRENAVLQALEGDSGLAWAEGMALQVVDAVPDDTDGEIGDVVFIPGGPGGSTPAVGGGKVLQVVRATLDSDQQTNKTSSSDVPGWTLTITPTKANSSLMVSLSARIYVQRAAGGDQRAALSILGTDVLADDTKVMIVGGQTGSGNLEFHTVQFTEFTQLGSTNPHTFKVFYHTYDTASTVCIQGSAHDAHLFAYEIEEIKVSP